MRELTDLRASFPVIDAFSPVLDANGLRCLLLLRDGSYTEAVRVAWLALSSRMVDDEAAVATFAVTVAARLAAADRWVDAEALLAVGEQSLARVTARDVEAADRIRFDYLAVAVRVEHATTEEDRRLKELEAELARPRAQNRLDHRHVAALAAVGWVRAARGELAAAGVHLARALRLDGDREPEAWAGISAELVFIRFRQGRWAEARRLAKHLHDSTPVQPSPALETVARAVEALNTALSGEDSTGALGHAESALTRRWEGSAGVLVAHAEIAAAFARQRWQEALDALDAAETTGYIRMLSEHEWHALRTIAAIHAGNVVSARAEMADWASLSSAARSPYFSIVSSMVAFAAGATNEAVAAAQRAQQLLTSDDDPLGAAQVHVIAGTVLSRSSRRMDGIDAYERARLILHDLGATGFVAACDGIIARTTLQVSAASSDPLKILTPQQRRVVELVADGYTSPEIADLLTLARKTVDLHVSNALVRLRLAGRAALRRTMLEHRRRAAQGPIIPGAWPPEGSRRST